MIVLKILAAPVMVALSLLAAMVTFLFCVASAVCELGCIVLTLLSLILFIGGQTVGGIVFLVLAFLVSPFGVPAIAEWLVDKLHSAKFALRDFITGRYFGTKCLKAETTAADHSRCLSYRKEGCLRPRLTTRSTKSARAKPSRSP